MQREMFSDKKFMAALEAAAEGDSAGGDSGGGGDLMQNLEVHTKDTSYPIEKEA